MTLPCDQTLRNMAEEPCDQGAIPFPQARAMATEILRLRELRMGQPSPVDVHIEDAYADGTAWKLFVNGFGVAMWPRSSTEPRAGDYAREVARVLRMALGHAGVQCTEQEKPSANPDDGTRKLIAELRRRAEECRTKAACHRAIADDRGIGAAEAYSITARELETDASNLERKLSEPPQQPSSDALRAIAHAVLSASTLEIAQEDVKRIASGRLMPSERRSANGMSAEELLAEVHRWRHCVEYMVGTMADHATPEECRAEMMRVAIKEGKELAELRDRRMADGKDEHTCAALYEEMLAKIRAIIDSIDGYERGDAARAIGEIEALLTPHVSPEEKK